MPRSRTRVRPWPLALGLAASLLVGGAAPQAPDVEQAVDALSRALLSADGPALEGLTMDGLSYGHSSGVVQDKAAFVGSIASRHAGFTSITLSDRKASVVGEDAIVRHVFSGEATADGKPSPVHIGVLQVWHREGERWRLLARQAFKI